MEKYELAVLLHPDLEIDLNAPLKKLEKLIQDAGGKIVERDDWGKRKLAYAVAKQGFALYFFYQIELPREGVAQLEKGLLITDEVLRHLIVRFQEIPVTATKPEQTADTAETEVKSKTATKSKTKPAPKAAKITKKPESSLSNTSKEVKTGKGE